MHVRPGLFFVQEDEGFEKNYNFLMKILILGEEFHECRICKKSFNEKSNLIRHLLIHTGVYLNIESLERQTRIELEFLN